MATKIKYLRKELKNKFRLDDKWDVKLIKAMREESKKHNGGKPLPLRELLKGTRSSKEK